ncbi:MAG: beta-glucosidase [Firmicutes bacterium]|nr:beta-glucosidase [Bacillota bacterium]
MRTILGGNKRKIAGKLLRRFSVFLLSVCISLNTNPLVNADTKLDRKIDQLLNRMTLTEKIGQMTQVDRIGLFEISDIQEYGLGSLLFGGDSILPGTTPGQLADLVERYQAAALKSRLKIPLIFGVDAVHGFNNIADSVIFPHNIGMGATGDPTLVEKAARITAIEMAGTGIKWTFAPCVAVARDERWGRTYESYGETPELSTTFGVAAIKGFQGAELQNSDSVVACAKHYIGDGGTLHGTGIARGNDQGDASMTEDELRRVHLTPYIEAVKNGVRTIMVSHSGWNGQKLHGHEYLLTKVLKEELGFTGFLVSDWKSFLQLPGTYEEQVAAAINAGIDMMMVVDSYQLFINTTKKLVESGKIPLSRIDDAARRILKVKFELGLLNRPKINHKLRKTIGSEAHREVARECVRKSLVLLKNHSRTLPLSKNLKHLLVAGKSADDLGNQCGGWTITWHGGSGKTTTGTTILQGIRNAVSKETVVSYDRDGKSVQEAEAAIVVIGETPYAETKGDIVGSKTLHLDETDRATIENVKKLGIPMVIILVSGRPMIISEELNQSDAFLAAWLPGTEGQGVADVLFGDYSPTGKLPCSWPKNMDQIPVNIGDADYAPLFEYGFGLSY